jgi:phosphoglycolate phosphatase
MRGWTLVFDLDGTLIDTAPDLAAATNHVLARAGLAPIDEREIRPFVGHGALRMIEGALTAHGRKASPSELNDHFEVFITHYTENIAATSLPYPGVIAALNAFKGEGATLAVCTNKIEAHAKALFRALDMTDYFSAVTGRDSLGAHKPDPRHLLGTIALASGRQDRSIMIGDSETDIRTAQAAHVPVIAVDFGYSVEAVASFAPDAVISHFDELAGAANAIARMRPAVIST